MGLIDVSWCNCQKFTLGHNWKSLIVDLMLAFNH